MSNAHSIFDTNRSVESENEGLEEEDEFLMENTYSMFVSWLHRGHVDLTQAASLLRTFPRLPLPPQPLQECDLKYQLENEISDGGLRENLQKISRSISAKYNNEENLNTATSNLTPSTADPSSPMEQTNKVTPFNSIELLLGREAGLGQKSQWTPSQKRCALCPAQLPTYATQVVDDLRGHAYLSKFSPEGDLYVACFQDQRILIYRPEDEWELHKHITAQMLRWTITDTCFSPDSQFLIYSTISPVLHMVKIRGEDNVVDSQANITEIHEPLIVETEDIHDMFGIWSVAWSKSTNEILVGTSSSNRHICMYDFDAERATIMISGHHDDVNSVVFMDDASQVFVSASDDSTIKVWDKRDLRNRSQSAVGVFVGHTEGTTNLDAKGDGRYLLSNAKDQTIKLWDIRRMTSPSEADRIASTNCRLPRFFWDYRTNQYPGRGYAIKHPRDVSLATFRGHTVLRTLIRAYFSPLFSTGQRYVYTGCHSGTIRIFDILTGEIVRELDEHTSIVRDCSWHPYYASLVSASWDGRVIEWTPRKPETSDTQIP